MPKSLFWFTVTALVAVTVVMFYFPGHRLPPQVEINTEGQPTIGYSNAAVQVVVFEEPKCSHCKEFTEKLYPQIKKTYIDTNKIRFTVIPVSFLPGSMPAAIALLCAYQQDKEFPNDEIFFTYLDYMYANQPEEGDWATTEELEKMAKGASPAINIEQLKSCIEKEEYRIKIEKNTQYGNKVMGRLTTPSVYVNGMLVDQLSFGEVSELIDAALENKGVH